MDNILIFLFGLVIGWVSMWYITLLLDLRTIKKYYKERNQLRKDNHPL